MIISLLHDTVWYWKGEEELVKPWGKLKYLLIPIDNEKQIK